METILGIVIVIALCCARCYPNVSVQLLGLFGAISIIHFWHMFAAAFAVDFPPCLSSFGWWIAFSASSSSHSRFISIPHWMQNFCTSQAALSSGILNLSFLCCTLGSFRVLLDYVASQTPKNHFFLGGKDFLQQFLDNKFYINISKCTSPNEVCGTPWECINIIITTLWVGNSSYEGERWPI